MNIRSIKHIIPDSCQNGKRLATRFTIALAVIFLTACSTTSTLSDNERLYKGHRLDIADRSGIGLPGIKKEIKNEIHPAPNDRFLGIPLKLWIYNFIGEDIPEKGLRNWMQEKLGQPPVIYEDIYSSRSEINIEQHLFNRGYFNASASSVTTLKDKKVKADYTVIMNERYHFDTVFYSAADDTLSKFMKEAEKISGLKSGQPYDLEKIKEERSDVSRYLRNQGFYFFDPSHLVIEADTNSSASTIRAELKPKNNIPENAKKRHRINNITVDTDHSLEDTDEQADTTRSGDILILYNRSELKPRLIKGSVMFEKDRFYSYNDYINTINKFSGLGIFKFTNISFKQAESDQNLLDIRINLTRSVPKSLQAIVRATTKSNNYVGPELSLGFINRNTFGGAERLSTNLNSSFETQYGKQDGGNVIELGIDANLAMPRFIFPFIDLHKYLSKKYTPKTNIKAAYTYHFRTKYFRMNTLNLLYSYNWNETARKNHDLKIINLSLLNLSKRTDEFEEVMENNSFIRQSFNEQLILSLNYTYTYNSQARQEANRGLSFFINAESAGGVLSLASRLSQGEFPEASDPARVMGVKYSQFARLHTDLRYYLPLGEGSKLAGRLILGTGKAYGNSDILPYTKQFYIGGASDVRAFFSHTVGPGSYSPPDTLFNSYFEQVGEIKLEANLEYRFGISGMLKGALFLDAGNVWLTEPDPDKPGGSFKWNDTFKELAVGTGFGLRFDASVLILRADLGIPVRKPWLPESERWVLNEINPGDAQWRKNNIVLNIAIGYPF
ncbi:MAG: BamA/TamA family outer membrane protein [Bacteroidales bacterium]